jgi:glutamate receptor, ionotropic, plant
MAESQYDLSTIHCHAIFQSAMVLAQRYGFMMDDQPIGWRSAFTGGDAINALSSICQSISNSTTVGIVGPAFSREAHILATFARKVNLPLISYSATDPTLSDRNTYPTFYRTVSSDGTIALALAQLFLRFNWTTCIIIYQNDAYGTNGADVISNTFAKSRITVINTLIFDTATSRVRGSLKDTLLNSPTRIVVLWAQSSHSSTILQHAIHEDVLGPHFLWILSTTVPLTTFHPKSFDRLVGMLSIEASIGDVVGAEINSALLTEAYEVWQEYQTEIFPGASQVSDSALFTFDATWSLIQSLQQHCRSNRNSSSCLSITNSTSCFRSYI